MRVMTPRWPTASADEKTPMDCQSWNSLQPVLCVQHHAIAAIRRSKTPPHKKRTPRRDEKTT